MDFEPQEELDSPRKVGGRRRARVYDEANPDDDFALQQPASEGREEPDQNQRAARDSLKDVQIAPEGLEMAVRYEVCWTISANKLVSKLILTLKFGWTEVADGRSVGTHSVFVDSLSHFLVQEVIEFAINAFVEQLFNSRGKTPTSFIERRFDKWEMRFATRAGLPRYDYPSLEPSQLLNKIASFNKVGEEERRVLEPDADKVIEPERPKEVQKCSMSTNDTVNESVAGHARDSINVSPQQAKLSLGARLCRALGCCFGKAPKSPAPGSPLLSKNVSVQSSASEQSIRSPLLQDH